MLFQIKPVVILKNINTEAVNLYNNISNKILSLDIKELDKGIWNLIVNI